MCFSVLVVSWMTFEVIHFLYKMRYCYTWNSMNICFILLNNRFTTESSLAKLLLWVSLLRWRESGRIKITSARQVWIFLSFRFFSHCRNINGDMLFLLHLLCQRNPTASFTEEILVLFFEDMDCIYMQQTYWGLSKWLCWCLFFKERINRG